MNISKTTYFCLLGLLAVFVVPAALFALGTVPPTTLETAPTHWDGSGDIWGYDGANRVIDKRDGRIQSISQLREGPYKGAPEIAARAFLMDHQDWVGLVPDEKNLRVARVAESPLGKHVTFERVINSVVVYPGNLVVSLTNDGYVMFYFSSLYPFSDAVATTPSLTRADAERIATDYLHPTVLPGYVPREELVIWAGDNRDFSLCWKFRAYYDAPLGDWEVLVDANSGAIRRVKDLSSSVNGTGNVYDPDPLSQASATYGTGGFVDNSDANSADLNSQLINRVLLDITRTNIFPGVDIYTLDGPWVHLNDIEAPAGAPVSLVNTAAFDSVRSTQAFEDVMCYYHIDKSQRWIQSLGFGTIQHGSIACDPHGLNGADNSHYVPGDNHIAFGEGGVDDAEDADVIWHEYGHAIQASQVPGWGGGDENRMGEGFGDYWATSYSRSQNNFRNNWVFNWDGHNPFWAGRVVDANLHYPEDNTGVHFGGQIWSQACYDAETTIGRGAMDYIVLQHHFLLGVGASMLTAAQAIVTTDINWSGGFYLYAISDAFVPRGLLTRPSNDQCSGSINIFALPYSTTGSTATADNNINNCVGTISPDVFYTLNPSGVCDRRIIVSLCGSGYDTGIEVRTGGDCPGLFNVNCNDDDCGLQSQTFFTAVAGLPYYIIVHGFSTYAGAYTLNVTGTNFGSLPANDECAGSLPINSLPYSDAGSTCGAANNYPSCIGFTSADVFYTLNLLTCQTVTASLCGSGYDTGLEVRTAGGCPGAQPVACDDDYCAPYGPSQVTFVANALENYYLIVHGFGPIDAGPYTLNVTGVPFFEANDACPGVAVIGALPYTDFGSTRCANYEGYPHIGSNAPDVIYQITPATCQTLRASNCIGTNYDSRIDVRAGGNCPGDMLVAWNDDFCGVFSQVDWFAAAGVPYYIIQYGFAGNTGSFELQVTSQGAATAPNDLCAGAKDITSIPYLDYGSTVCATNQISGCYGASSNDVVYRLNVGAGLPCTTLNISLCGSNYDTGLRVMTGGACPGSTEVACDDDSGCPINGGGLSSNVFFTYVPGQDYWIHVDGFGSGSSGTYKLSVTSSCQPESLVVQRMPASNDVRLTWAAPRGAVGGSINYKVYRSNSFPVATIPANLIVTTVSLQYVDAGRVGNAALQSFYTVTADAFFAQTDPGDGAISGIREERKNVDPAVLNALQETYIPVYFDPANIHPLDPAKVATLPTVQYPEQMNPAPQNNNYPAQPK